MSRKKRTISKVLENAAARAAGLESIDAALDFGNGMTLESYRTAIEAARAKQTAYNTLLAWGDEARTEFNSAEAGIRALSDRMLSAVAAKYGRDSNEYEKAGGTRMSDRKRTATRKEEETPMPVVAVAKAA